MRIKKGFVLREVAGQIMVIATGEASKDFHGMIKLNATGKVIWLGLQEGLSQEEIAALEKNGSLALNLDGSEAVIETTDVEIFSEDIPGWLVANEGKLTVALEVTVTEELRREGVARELVNRIQNIRKSSGFEITDKINIVLSKNNQTDDAVNEYKEYICNQVLANSLTLADEVEGTELEFDDFKLYASVCKC